MSFDEEGSITGWSGWIPGGRRALFESYFTRTEIDIVALLDKQREGESSTHSKICIGNSQARDALLRYDRSC